ncbi:MAG: nuclear transport factor 2 family protein [Acidobacteriia bacterium]|nr:nuclear transport factor 2 family protein [Terriglobia bacterium]
MKLSLPGLALGLVLASPTPIAAQPAAGNDIAAIRKAIHASIGWALTKDRALLESVLSHDPAFFIFHPDSKTTVAGWEPMEKLFGFWMDPRFKATGYEIRDLRINLSRSGDVSWFSAVLDDCGAWDGKPSCWKDTRWTGVLEKRDGAWVIVQMHFSFARDPAPTRDDRAGGNAG